MALEGTIRDFGLPDIFQLIGLQRKTGLLTLRSDKETVTVTFENGMVVMADSSSKRLEDRLGNVLVKQGKLPKERLDEVLQTQRATLQRLGTSWWATTTSRARTSRTLSRRRSPRSSSRSSAGAMAITTSRPRKPWITTGRTSPP